MHNVDPMEVMLSDIFDKVFYKLRPDYKGVLIVTVKVRWRSKSSCLRILTET